MKAKVTRRKILSRTLEAIPYEFTKDYVVAESIYGSRNRVKVSHKFFDYGIRKRTEDEKKEASITAEDFKFPQTNAVFQAIN